MNADSKIVGIDRSIASRKASIRDIFNNLPPLYTMPDLDVPGIIAKTWKRPMMNPSFILSSLIVLIFVSS